MSGGPRRGLRELRRRWRRATRELRTEAAALALAARDPRVGWPARVVLFLTVAYALSPVDLIPDVIPVLGYADDLLIVPLGLLLARRLVPAEVLVDCRARVQAGEGGGLPRRAVAVVVGTWVALAAVLGVGLWRAVG